MLCFAGIGIALMGMPTFLMESPHWSHMNQGILVSIEFARRRLVPPATVTYVEPVFKSC